MCIRDRRLFQHLHRAVQVFLAGREDRVGDVALSPVVQLEGCLLYTSDAADERSSVDLGGRRIIKKTKKKDKKKKAVVP